MISKRGFTMFVSLVLAATLVLSSGLAPALQVSASPAGTALAFNGTNQYVNLYQSASNTGPGVKAFTIETWFKYSGGVTASTGNGGIIAIPLVTKGRGEADGDNRDMNYFLGIQGGKLAADFEECHLDATACPNADPNGSYNGGLNYPVLGTTVITTGIWHHAAATLDGTNFCLYLDGQLDNCRLLPAPTPRWPRWDSIQRAALGSAIDSLGVASGYLAGTLDENRVWGVALTQSQIQANMNQEIVSDPNLVARWGMNEGTGATINSSVGSFPGTLVNAPTWTAGFPIADTTPPAAPSGLAAQSGGEIAVLTWNANTESDLAGYYVYRSLTSPVAATTPINTTF